MVPNPNKSLSVNQNGNYLLINLNYCIEHYIVYNRYLVNKTENYEEAYRRSLEDPEGFWAEVGAVVDWYKPWDKVLDNSAQPLTDW